MTETREDLQGKDTEVSGEQEASVLDEKLGESMVRRRPLVMFADAALRVEKVRVAAQVRLKHLGKRNNTCPDTQELLRRAEQLEDWVDKRLAQLVYQHPVAPWFTRIKGTGGELIGKVLGHIEAFGKFYDIGDPLIPSFVNRESVWIEEEKDGKKTKKEKIWVEGIERFATPSKLRKYMGFVPGLRREAGKKLSYNAELKMMAWRLGTSLQKSKGKYYEFYLDYKERLRQRFLRDGIRMIPTPKGRHCPVCEKEVNKKAARFCPECGGPLSLKNEPTGVIFEGHLHMMAMRRMIQLFSDHLWVVWREALRLPVREPYAIEYKGHTTIISPWDMVDRDA